MSVNQLKANRANAMRSTGPKSILGKARSSMNACKHGLTCAKQIVVGDEDVAEFELLRANFIEDLKPQSAVEYELVDQLAMDAWRLRRIPRLEAELLEARRSEVEKKRARQEEYARMLNFTRTDEDAPGTTTAPTTPPEPAREFGLALIVDSQKSDAFWKLSRHESLLRNRFWKTLQLLKGLQAQRAEERTLKVVSGGEEAAA